jgi:uncharacterized protein (DUF302 family)
LLLKAAIVDSKPFAGERIVVHTDRAFDDLLKTLRQLMGRATLAEINALAEEPISEGEFSFRVQERYVGSSGFMLFAEIDHGRWLPKFGINQRMVRWILGNPLYAITMIRHDKTAGLFAPVELLVTEDSHQRGTTVTYVRPSSLMLIETNVPLLDAAQALDAKLAALVADATDVAELGTLDARGVRQ